MSDWLFFMLGSPPIHGEEVEGADFNDVGNKSNQYTSGVQDEKQKIERILDWDASSGQKEHVATTNYDKEVSLNHIPYLASRQSVGWWGCVLLSYSCF